MRYSKQDLDIESTNGRFLNQFILGPEFLGALEGWQRVELPAGYRLSAHPQLEIRQATSGPLSATLIGFLLDPEYPQHDNAEVLNALVSGTQDVGGLITATFNMGGRWVLLASDNRETVLFNDALGLRQVFHTDANGAHGHWFMSQPGLLAGLKKLTPDPAAMEFLDADVIRVHAEYRWPATASPVAGIHRLLPNHLVSLPDGKVTRYWPKGQLEEVAIDRVVSKVGDKLKGTMDAASRRFDLALGITAGYDSRIVMAACRDFISRLSLVTVRNGHLPDRHPDLEISARLAEKAGLEHTVVKSMPYMSAAFSKGFKQNVFLAHDYYGTSAEAIWNTFGGTKAVATGSGAEVAREPFRKRIDPRKSWYTAEDLARLQWMGAEPFAVRYFQRWLDQYPVASGLHVLDLFSWEQSHGSWLAATHLEFDYAWREIFTPFNNRSLLVAMLGLDERFRCSPDNRLFNALIETRWPELLEEPINPHFKRRDKRFSARLLRRLALCLKARG